MSTFLVALKRPLVTRIRIDIGVVANLPLNA